MKWTASDASQLREYNKKSNGALVQLLKSRIPRCTAKTIESVALQAKFKEGYEIAIKEIEDLMTENLDDNDASNGRFISM